MHWALGCDMLNLLGLADFFLFILLSQRLSFLCVVLFDFRQILGKSQSQNQS